jgi:hypothetical protein
MSHMQQKAARMSDFGNRRSFAFLETRVDAVEAGIVWLSEH